MGEPSYGLVRDGGRYGRGEKGGKATDYNNPGPNGGVLILYLVLILSDLLQHPYHIHCLCVMCIAETGKEATALRSKITIVGMIGVWPVHERKLQREIVAYIFRHGENTKAN